MGVFDWLLGRKPAETIPAVRPAPPARNVPFPTSSPPPPATFDLRTNEDRAVETQARQTLDADLEELAALVGRLGHEYQDMGDAKWQQMQNIGRQLNERGGLRLMQLVCNRARELGGRASSVSASWRGIGEWQH